MILKGISAFPIGKLGARMKDYKKKKENITQSNTWKPLFVCTYKTNILITNNTKNAT